MSSLRTALIATATKSIGTLGRLYDDARRSDSQAFWHDAKREGVVLGLTFASGLALCTVAPVLHKNQLVSAAIIGAAEVASRLDIVG
jgi:hypothetical protein